MTDRISNYSSQLSIHSQDFKNLYIVTGKGGVGKSLLSLSCAYYISEHTKGKKKVLYLNFDDQLPVEKKVLDELKIEYFPLSLEKSAQEYMSRKLGSATISSWIMKTPFFNGLFNIVPGLGNLILIGHVIDIINKEPDTIIVADSPSTGHLLSILESPKNFFQIFKEGAIVNDIKKMQTFMENKDYFQIIISSLPTELSVKESLDLEQELKSIGDFAIRLCLNETLSDFFNGPQIQTQFLKNKVETEKNLLQLFKNQHVTKIAYSTNFDTVDKIRDIAKNIGQLVCHKDVN
ncbi:MAG: hypothetical protein H6622_10570 [Halobacteriovoraceae bacterium]|nr:hypothetical protein [Halobacteriovoraceae bacterium]